MKKHFGLLTLFLAACSHQAEDLRAVVEQQDARISALERDAAANPRAPQDQGAETAAKPDPAVADLEKTVARLANAQARLEAQIRSQELRMDGLEKPRVISATGTNEVAERPPGKILPSKSPVISIYTAPDNRLADFIETPAGDNPDLFPVRITAVTGRKTIVGTHKTTRIVESGDDSKDNYGRKIPEQKEIQEDVNEYAMEVAFAAQNLTRTEKIISFTAGGATRVLTLRPGEPVSELVIRSAIGANLHVEVNGQIKNFPVTY